MTVVQVHTNNRRKEKRYIKGGIEIRGHYYIVSKKSSIHFGQR